MIRQNLKIFLTDFVSRIMVSLFAGALLAHDAFAGGITLEQAIREVCTRSDSVKMMKESVKKADEMVREKWSNAFPVIAASAYTARNRGSMFGGGSSSSSMTRQIASAGSSANSVAPLQAATAGEPPDSTVLRYGMIKNMFSGFSDPQYTTLYGAGLSINQPLFTFGKIGTAVDVARRFNVSAKETYRRNLQTLQLQAIDAFSSAVIAQKYAEISDRSLERKKSLYEFLQRNFQLGAGSKAQVLATRADAFNQSSLALSARRDAMAARMYLNIALGRELGDSTALDTLAVPQVLTDDVSLEAGKTIAEAIDRRQDIKALKNLAASNRGGAKIFRAMYLPTIGASGSLSYSKMESGSKLVSTDGMGNWSIGVGASWTLFDGFANSARAAQYESDADKLEIASAAIAKAVEVEIRSAIEECKAADSNMTASQEALAAAKESYELTNSNFKQGSGQLADLQRVEDMLQLAELGQTSARYRQIRSHAALLVATGKEIVLINEEEK